VAALQELLLAQGLDVTSLPIAGMTYKQMNHFAGLWFQIKNANLLLNCLRKQLIYHTFIGCALLCDFILAAVLNDCLCSAAPCASLQRSQEMP
jgi:hypothetical protein